MVRACDFWSIICVPRQCASMTHGVHEEPRGTRVRGMRDENGERKHRRRRRENPRDRGLEYSSGTESTHCESFQRGGLINSGRHGREPAQCTKLRRGGKTAVNEGEN